LGIDFGHPVAEVDERFLSFAVDTAQVVGGDFWAPPAEGEGLLETQRVSGYDFARVELRRLAGALAPAYLRIGGTDADRTVYRLDDGAPAVPGRGALWTLTRQRWDEVNGFARDLGLRVMFTLNAGPSARDADGRWEPDNARALVAYSQQRGYPVDVWELGNEVSAFPLTQATWLSAERYADDVARARAMLDELHTPARLAGLGTAFWPVMGEWRPFSADFLARAGQQLDIVTWHYYPQQSHRCPIATRRAHPGTMATAAQLADVERWADFVETNTREHAPAASVWLGETGGAQCGGEPGVSNTFADALWWLDELGRLARRGEKVVVRQTLSGSDYGLVDDRTLAPNPSYWASWLWRRLMGKRVFAASIDPPAPALRAYAHCLRDDAGGDGGPATAVLLVNLDPTATTTVSLPAGSATPRALLRLQADALGSRLTRLNGVVLRPGADGSPPPLPIALPETGARDISMPPLSIAFAVLPDGGAACH
jgi:heparanase 1